MTIDLYYEQDRQHLFRYLPARAERVLDVGCGGGKVGEALLRSGRADIVVGVEPVSEAAAAARHRLTEVHEGTVERYLADENRSREAFDLIVCADVLEHLVDPWTVVRLLRDLLRPGGALVVSLPNVRNLRVLLPLVFSGRFDYRDSGLLDRTHLRFFTERSARELVTQAGLTVIEHGRHRAGSRFPLVPTLVSVLGPFLVDQHILVCTGEAALPATR